jgi:hypothetical protein
MADRYLLLLLPLAMMIIGADTKLIIRFNRLSIVIACILLIPYGVFSIGATHDNLSCNRVRWNALNNLMQNDRISSRDIYGGFEFDCWYAAVTKFHTKPIQPLKPWLFYTRARFPYLVALGPVAGYAEIKKYPFRRWLPWGQGDIFVLRRSHDG